MLRLKRFLKSYFKANTAKQIHAKHSKTNTPSTVQTDILRLKKLLKLVPQCIATPQNVKQQDKNTQNKKKV